MQLRAFLLRTFDFNARANIRIAEALHAAGRPVDEEVKLLGHVLNVEKIWFLRLEGFDTGATAAWPALTLNECAELARITAETAKSFLQRRDGAAFEQSVQYRNIEGDVFTNTVADILTHLSHHGAYHRAQINRLLREHGNTPAKVDFISFARE